MTQSLSLLLQAVLLLAFIGRQTGVFSFVHQISSGFEKLQRDERDGRKPAPKNVAVLPGLSQTAALPVEGKPQAFQILVDHLIETVIASDEKRDSKGQDGASTGWTSWVDEAAAAKLSNAVASIQFEANDKIWKRWLFSAPSPMILEYSPGLMKQVDACLNVLGTTNEEEPSQERRFEETYNRRVNGDTSMARRLGMRLFYLPSGETFQTKLQAPPGALIYGVALLGGVKRFRCIGTNRRAGERTVIVSDKASETSWMQYGGPERNYEAIDIGPCLFMEILLYPDGLEVDLLSQDNTKDVLVLSPSCNPNNFLSSRSPELATHSHTAEVLTNMDANRTSFDTGVFRDEIILSVGGLQSQIDQIVRRVVDGRAYQGSGRSDMAFLYSLGLSPTRGLLLYGPPGCGKTHLARVISRFIDSHPPKIVAAPELLDRWVGSTERNVRALFADAEEELYQKCGGDATKSKLHVIVIDEIDAVFRKRSSADGTSEVTRASAVNQILARLDGVQMLDNILLIGMTNRKELLDPALLRPGRLEVKIEIPLPDEAGRRDILKIHFGPLRERGKLSQPLCDAIDGVLAGRLLIGKGIDLAVQTRGFSGADIAGLVRNAGSIALERTRRQSMTGGIDGLVVTLEDVRLAFEEASPHVKCS